MASGGQVLHRGAKEGDDTYRTLTLGDGGKIKEKLISKGNLTYRYAIVESPLPVKNYEAQFSVTPDDDDEDEVNVVWAATYDAADGKDDKDARSTIDGIFKDGIASIKGKIGDKAVERRRRTRTEVGRQAAHDCQGSRDRRGPFLFALRQRRRECCDRVGGRGEVARAREPAAAARPEVVIAVAGPCKAYRGRELQGLDLGAAPERIALALHDERRACADARDGRCAALPACPADGRDSRGRRGRRSRFSP